MNLMNLAKLSYLSERKSGKKAERKRVELEGEPICTKYVKFDGAVKSEGIIYKKIKTIS